MRILISLLALTASCTVWASPLGEKFCEDKATAYFRGYHQRVLDEVGVIQGYIEDVSLDYSQVINDMDNRSESYHFFVRAENDEADWWTWEYVVRIEAWLEAGGKPRFCDLQEIQFLGVTEQSESL